MAEEKTKEIKATFQKQIEKMQMEVKQLKIAKKEHQKALKQQASTDKELKAMKKDLDEMKKQRVKLMHKMREDANRNRQAVSSTTYVVLCSIRILYTYVCMYIFRGCQCPYAVFILVLHLIDICRYTYICTYIHVRTIRDS